MKYFEGIASGLIDAPKNNVFPEYALFNNDIYVTKFANCHFELSGNFDKHYWASIPYVLEQECRLGSAVLRYSAKNGPLSLWCMNMAEATIARSLSKLGNGLILSLANTTNSKNKDSFYAHGIPEHAYLEILSDEMVIDNIQTIAYKKFINGFDIIIEDTSFQMKSPDRLTQIKNTSKVLRKDGILIMTEKFLGDDYDYWEHQKDVNFKLRFFEKAAIKNKETHVLKNMILNQVSISDMKDIALQLFSYGIIFWNSGNFYSIAVCNNENLLIDFINEMIQPCIPNEFSRSNEIFILFGITKNKFKYRLSES